MEPGITADPAILGGKPCIRGTRLSVAFILELVASGASLDDIQREYPHAPREGIEAAVRYAALSLESDVVWDLRLAG